MRRIVLWLVLVTVILMLAGCAPKATEEASRALLEKHEQLFSYYVGRFTEQRVFERVTLKDNVIGNRFYSVITEESAARQRAETTFKIPANFFKDDEEYWAKDPGTIVSTKQTGSLTLRELMKKQKVASVDFHVWRTFLRGNKLYSIGRGPEKGQVEMKITESAGYLYAPKGTPEPSVNEGVKLVKLRDGWYYFGEE